MHAFFLSNFALQSYDHHESIKEETLFIFRSSIFTNYRSINIHSSKHLSWHDRL